MKITFSMVGILLVSLSVSGCMYFRTDESKSLLPLGSQCVARADHGQLYLYVIHGDGTDLDARSCRRSWA